MTQRQLHHQTAHPPLGDNVLKLHAGVLPGLQEIQLLGESISQQLLLLLQRWGSGPGTWNFQEYVLARLYILSPGSFIYFLSCFVA